MIKAYGVYYFDKADFERLAKDEIFAKRMKGKVMLPIKFSEKTVMNSKGEHIRVTLQVNRPGSRKARRHFTYKQRNKWGQPKCNNYGSFKGTTNGKADRWLRSGNQDYQSAVFDYNEAVDKYDAVMKVRKNNPKWNESHDKALKHLNAMIEKIPTI